MERQSLGFLPQLAKMKTEQTKRTLALARSLAERKRKEIRCFGRANIVLIRVDQSFRTLLLLCF